MSDLVKWRFRLIIFFILVATGYTLVRYALHAAQGSPGRIGQTQTAVERGRILDRNGKVLAAETGTSRDYPEKNLAAQIIGFTGNGNIGREGIEYAFNRELSEGSDVILTIDVNVQHILEQVAASTLSRTRAESVMILAMDPRDGDILGSAVLPGFDPNDYNALSSRIYHNPAATSSYEPGSVFKIFSIAALMDAGVISEYSEFTCNGVYERTFSSGEKIRIECADRVAHGRVRPREIIIQSCNVGAALAAERLENQTFYELMLRFGFGNKTGAWVNSSTAEPPLMETAGLLKNPRIPGLWWGRTRQSIAFGQEIAVSALQIMQAASVIAHNGIMVPPKIVSRVVSAAGKTVINGENSNARRQVLSAETARKMVSYMENTASLAGTGWRADPGDIRIAVKTGTSQLRDPSTRRIDPATGRIVEYSETDFIASCIALLPANSPSLVLYVVVIKPRGEILGGRIAAPVIREAADALINYLGIPRERNPIVEHSGRIDLVEKTLPAIGTRVPDFSGLSKRTLLPLLNRSDIRVELFGEGWVRRQAPPPGTPITPGMLIELELE